MTLHGRFVSHCDAWEREIESGFDLIISIYIACLAEAGKQQALTSAPAIQETVVRNTQNGVVQPAKSSTPSEIAPGKVPEGFFDNVDADHRARGLEPPKVDIK